jgi:hypothetical protein
MSSWPRCGVVGGALFGIVALTLAFGAGALPVARAGVLPTPIPPGLCRDGAAFQADVTIADNTVVQPGARLEKTWRIRNSGTCSWTSAYRLTYVGGNSMGAAGSQPVAEVVPGTSADVTVVLYAPWQPGSYVGVWQMANPAGTRFGDRVTAVIQSGSGSPIGPAPTAAPTPVVQRQFTGKVVKWWPNCGSTYVKGRIVDQSGNPVNGLRVHVWADGWDGSFSRVSGVGDTYGPGEWDVALRQGQTGKFYVQVWDWQTGPDSYVRVDSDMLTLEFNYTQQNCQPDSDGHQVAELQFTRNR